MAKDIRDSELAKNTKALQENAERAGPAAGASYTLIGGIILLGGLVLGIIVGMWELAKVVWHR